MKSTYYTNALMHQWKIIVAKKHCVQILHCIAILCTNSMYRKYRSLSLPRYFLRIN